MIVSGLSRSMNILGFESLHSMSYLHRAPRLSVVFRPRFTRRSATTGVYFSGLPVWLLGVVLLSLSILARGAEPRPFPHPDRIRYDSQCLTIDGRDVMIFSGSFHYFRCPKELWADRFQKIKDAGFNCVSTYTPWICHERERPSGVDDFSKVTGLQDLDDWLTMAEKFGFYVIIRPGPYVCAEWEGGRVSPVAGSGKADLTAAWKDVGTLG